MSAAPPRFSKSIALERAVDFIAWNDEPTCLDVDQVAGQLSVITAAVMLNTTGAKVAALVIGKREEAFKAKALSMYADEVAGRPPTL